MANPCTITYEGKEYSIAEFAAQLHDGLLDALIESKDVTLAKESGFDKAIDFLENLKADNKSKLNAFGILPEVWNAAISGLQAALKAGKSVTEALDGFIKELKDNGQTFDEKQVRDVVQSAIEKGMQTKPKVETSEKTEGKKESKKTESGKKERRFTQQFIKEYPSLEGSLKEDTIVYSELPNKVTLEEANGIIDYLGEEEALKAFKDLNNGMTWATRNTIGQILIKKFNSQGQYDKAIEALEELTQDATELGQGIQVLSLFQYLTPEGQLRLAEKTRQKQNEKIVSKNKEKIDEATTELQNVNAKIVDEVVKEVENKIESADKIQPDKKEKPKSYGAENKLVTKDRYEQLKKSIKGKMFSNIPPELFEIAAFHLEAASRKFGAFSKQMISDFGNKVKPYLKTLYGDAKSKLSSTYNDFESDADVNAQFDELVGDKMFEESQPKAPKPPSIKSIIKKHYTTPSNTTLEQKLIDQLGLSEKEAKDIASSAQRAFEKLGGEQKAKILKKAFGKSKNTQTLIQNLSHLSSTGALSNTQVAQEFVANMGVPSLTPQQVQQITNLTNQVSQATSTFQKNKALQNLMAYQANLNKVSKWDIAMAIWYANVLSGHNTQLVNAVSNTTNALSDMLVSIAKNPKTGKMLVQAYLEGGYKGYFEGMEALRSGYSPMRSEVKTPTILERIDFKGGKFNPFNYAKYVGRFMTAIDTVFFEAARNMREYQWADMLASNNNLPVTTTYKKRAEEYMNNSDAQINAAKAQAEQEYQDAISKGVPENEAKRERRMRVFELIEEARQEEIRTEGQTFGQLATFTQPPSGLLGWAAKVLGRAGEQFKPLKLVVPFTNVIANVANKAIDFTPWGFARGLSQGSVSSRISDTMKRKDWDSMTADQRKVAKQEMLIRAMIGTMSMTALYMLTQPWDDDEEPTLEITANGTGDYKKNYQLQETGWQPYSIKYKGKWYSYQNTPLLVALSFIGNIRDYEKYRKEKPTDEGALTKMAIAANNTKTVFTDMTFLKGLNTFLKAVTESRTGNPLESVKSGAMSTVQGFVLPNLYTQIAKEIQSIYDIPTKEIGNTILGRLLKDVPVARNEYFDKINALGEPIIADADKFTSEEKDSPLFELLIDHKTFISVPSIKEKLVPSEDGTPRLMTNEEYYNFAKERGQYIKQYLESHFKELSKLSDKDFQRRLTSIQTKATKYAERKVIK